MEKFLSLTTCDMLVSTSSTQDRRLTKAYIERQIGERKIDTEKQKDYNGVKTQIFSGQQPVSCLLLHSVDSECF